MKQNENLAGWHFIWWLFTIFGLPITVPWFIYHFSSILALKKKKALLQGKVSLIIKKPMKYSYFSTMFIHIFRLFSLLVQAQD